MSNISILMVPGANCPPDLYEPTAQALKSKGQDANVIGTLTVAPRTGAPDGPLPTMYDDAAAIAKAVEKLADAGKDVILISHSYGGTPTTQSTKDLSKAERQAAGKPGGVVRLAYMTALVPAIGQATGALMADLPEESKLTPTIDERGWASYAGDIAACARVVISDLPAAEGEAWVKQFSQHASASFGDELTHAGYKDIPVSYLFCEDDKCVTPTIQQTGIDGIEKVSGRKVDVTRIKAGHCPNISQPEVTLAWILDVVKKTEATL